MKRVVSISSLVVLIALLSSPLFAAAQKEWTFAVFLNADNNLDPFGVEDQEEMSKIGSNDWLNIVTLIDRERGPACYNLIENGKVTKLEDLGEIDMGDHNRLVSFMKWVVTNYPAKKYSLTLWNHGSGWKQAGRKIVRGISYDDSSNNHITTNQLARALKEIKGLIGHNLDILNFDACLMQMAEVIYACKGSCDYVVGSEETEPGKGTPYDDVLKTLAQNSTPEAFSKTWVRAFAASYGKAKGSQGHEASTQSSFKVAAIGTLMDALDGFAKATMAGKFQKEFAAALGTVQKFAYPENVDLVHLATLIKASVKDPSMQTACTKLLSACKAAIVANATTEITMKKAKGLAIYFPSDSYSFEDSYKSLDFCKASQWDDMLSDFYKKKLGDRILKALENSDVSPLRDFVA
ncbi:hypothetical protein HYY75_05610, partial [bacterium]|nr:hypothetical protein [bacterium]